MSGHRHDERAWPRRELRWVYYHPLTTAFLVIWPIVTAIWAVWDATR